MPAKVVYIVYTTLKIILSDKLVLSFSCKNLSHKMTFSTFLDAILDILKKKKKKLNI